MLTGNNRQRHILWCRGKRHWQTKRWQKVIFSDKTQVVIGQNNSISLLRKTSKKNQRISPIKVSWIFSGCTTMALVIPVNGNSNSMKYLKLSDFHVWPNVILSKFSEIVHIFFKMTTPPLSVQDKEIDLNGKTELKKIDLYSPQTSIYKNIWRFFKI